MKLFQIIISHRSRIVLLAHDKEGAKNKVHAHCILEKIKINLESLIVIEYDVSELIHIRM